LCCSFALPPHFVLMLLALEALFAEALACFGVKELLSTHRTCRSLSRVVSPYPVWRAVLALGTPASARPKLSPPDWARALSLLCEHAIAFKGLTAWLQLDGLEDHHANAYARHPSLQMSIRRPSPYGMLLQLSLSRRRRLPYPACSDDHVWEALPDWLSQAELATGVRIVLALGSGQSRITVFQTSWHDSMTRFWMLYGKGLSWLRLTCAQICGFDVSLGAGADSVWRGDLLLRLTLPTSIITRVLGVPEADPQPQGPAQPLHVVGALYDLPAWPGAHRFPPPCSPLSFSTGLSSPVLVSSTALYFWRENRVDRSMRDVAGASNVIAEYGLAFRLSLDSTPRLRGGEPGYLSVWVLDAYGKTQFEAPCIKLKHFQPSSGCACLRETSTGVFYPLKSDMSSMEHGEPLTQMVARLRDGYRELVLLVLPVGLGTYFEVSWRKVFQRRMAEQLVDRQNCQLKGWISDEEEEKEAHRSEEEYWEFMNEYYENSDSPLYYESATTDEEDEHAA